MVARRWIREYNCHACKRLGKFVRATIRAFTGTAGYAGVVGGWPACDEHADRELEAALTALFRGTSEWRMTIYRIDADDEDWPRMTLVATIIPKPTALKGLPHA